MKPVTVTEIFDCVSYQIGCLSLPDGGIIAAG